MHQSFLPIYEDQSKRILGLIGITNTDFAGTETTFTIAGKSVAIAKVEQGPSRHPVREWFMALVIPYRADLNLYKLPGYIPLSDVQPTSWWVQSPGINGKIDYAGPLLTFLRATTDNSVSVNIVVPDAPTVTTPATLYWEANAEFANVPSCKYFDFNWVGLFQLDAPTDEPAYIEVVSVPASGEFGAFVIADAQPVLNTVVYNTIRIVKRVNGTITPNPYTFHFNIVDRLGNTVPVVLTLNIT